MMSNPLISALAARRSIGCGMVRWYIQATGRVGARRKRSLGRCDSVKRPLWVDFLGTVPGPRGVPGGFAYLYSRGLGGELSGGQADWDKAFVPVVW